MNSDSNPHVKLDSILHDGNSKPGTVKSLIHKFQQQDSRGALQFPGKAKSLGFCNQNFSRIESDSRPHDKLESILQDGSSKPCSFQLEDLRMMTDDFSNDRLIGEGGFGKVYKGVLQNGEAIAVKKLAQSMPLVQQKQFENEVHHLIRLRHPNIVRFVGYCYESQHEYVELKESCFAFAEVPKRLLCLEYLPRGSLDKYISDASSGLDWNTRYKTIKGICYGLHYLHEECKSDIKGSIIHLDLKPANILLDENMVPKIADFGLSRLFDDKKTETCTINLAGSLGYMAPEYIRGTITSKADIYSLGVMIIEIIEGSKDMIDPFNSDETACQVFVGRVLQNWKNRMNKAPSQEDYEQIETCLRVGLRCIKTDKNERPTTREIIELLNIGEIKNSFSNVKKPSANKIISGHKNLLQVTPLEICFYLERGMSHRCTIHLTNQTVQLVAFDFGVLQSRCFYYIEPSQGYVWPRTTTYVTITMKERPIPAKGWRCYDEFYVRSVRVSNSEPVPITLDIFDNRDKVENTVIRALVESREVGSYFLAELQSELCDEDDGSLYCTCLDMRCTCGAGR